MPPLDFLIIDDHPLFLEALEQALNVNYPSAKIDLADRMVTARSKLMDKPYNLVLLNLKMPDSDGFLDLKMVRETVPKTPIAVIAADAYGKTVEQVKASGADGFISKCQTRFEILQSIEGLLRGESQFPSLQAFAENYHPFVDKLRRLTPQQLRVLTYLCEAKHNKQIAYELGVAEPTIKAHVTLIFKKLGLNSRTQTALQLQRMRHELKYTEFSSLLPLWV